MLIYLLDKTIQKHRDRQPQAERDSVSNLVSFDLVLIGAGHCPSAHFPVADRLRVRGDSALEDRLASH